VLVADAVAVVARAALVEQQLQTQVAMVVLVLHQLLQVLLFLAPVAAAVAGLLLVVRLPLVVVRGMEVEPEQEQTAQQIPVAVVGVQ
jgi:hypothetical protein